MLFREDVGVEVRHPLLALLGHAEIAERLSLSQKTVRNYVSNIMSKLQVADRTQAILRAKDAGFEA